MACRAGITTDLQGRKSDWEEVGRKEGYKVSGWTKYGPFANQQKAQEWENKQTDCKRSGGGRPSTKTWHGYRFNWVKMSFMEKMAASRAR